MHVSFQKTPENSDNNSIEFFRRKNRFKQIKFSIYIMILQLVFFVIFLRLGVYSIRADASIEENSVSLALWGGAGRTEAGQLVKNITLIVRKTTFRSISDNPLNKIFILKGSFNCGIRGKIMSSDASPKSWNRGTSPPLDPYWTWSSMVPSL